MKRLRRVTISIVRERALELASAPAPQPPVPWRMLGREEAAELLGVSTETLRRWEAEGVLVPSRYGRWVAYASTDLAAFAARMRAVEVA